MKYSIGQILESERLEKYAAAAIVAAWGIFLVRVAGDLGGW